ncbi:MAG: Flp family type IVb pilin [Kordiimonadaceae bacterium]|nr:Flp family type IVb pilin [Kordiimonadaceae bacterium]
MQRLSGIYQTYSDQMRRVYHSTSGATAVEYALLVGLIALGVGGGLTAVADLVVGIFNLIVRETGNVADTVSTG